MKLTKTILIVDDEQDYADMICMRLEANGYNVVTAYDGESGLKAAKETKPNLILLDVMMPGMDGFQVLSRLRRDETTIHIPVVMLTARGETKAIMKSQQLHAKDHLIKPCESEELLSTVERYAR
ncbi:MAG: response regulator [Lentisphaerae bacterium]|nr:response regulator [Lentisphaerota bacterium]